MAIHNSSDDKFVKSEQKQERDLQGEGGGGGGGGCACGRLNMNNPSQLTNAIGNANLPNIRPDSITIDLEKKSHFKGSNEISLASKPSSSMESLKEVPLWMKRKAQSACTKKMLLRRIPILRWLPTYNSEDAIGDLVAGITVGLTVIPQALAYANIAGVPPEYGLYSSFMGSFIYIIFGSCKDVPMGPTAIAALLTYQAINGFGVDHAVLLCFITGLIQVLMGLFGLGFLIDFVSGPVSSGFTSAVALIIVTSQVKDILGIQGSGATFVETWKSLFQDIHNTKGWDTMLGISCICVLLIMRIIGTLKIGSKNDDNDESNAEELTKAQKVINKVLWLFGTARNAILVIVCGCIGYSFSLSGDIPFKVIGTVPQGLPQVQPPPFGYTEIRNGTEIHHSVFDMISNMGSGIIVVPILGLLENIAICKAFSNGNPVDATQELLAIGLSNVANSFFQAFPGTGSLSRSAVNNNSGVRTPLGGLYTGILVVLALLFFTPYFYYIPKATLAGIIIAAVVFMVEVKVVKPMWRSKKSDLILGVATFIACLILRLEYGILVGVGINLLFILYHAARPEIEVEILVTPKGTEYLMLTPDRCLIFPSVDYVRNLVTKHSIRQKIPVVIDCTHIYRADYTAAIAVESLTHDFANREQPLLFYNLKPSVAAVFEGLSPKEFVVFYNSNEIDNLIRKRSNKKQSIAP